MKERGTHFLKKVTMAEVAIVDLPLHPKSEVMRPLLVESVNSEADVGVFRFQSNERRNMRFLYRSMISPSASIR